MKTLKFIASILLVSVTLVSCEKYLDVKKNSDLRYMETAADCQLVLDDYTSMNNGYPSDAEASADDYYVNAASWASLSYQEDKDIYRWLPAAQREAASPQWQTSYYVVNKANMVLETLAKIQGTTDQQTWNALQGSALFFRAFVFWNLAQQYARPYTSGTAGQDLGIPLRLSTDLNDVYGRATVQQTYDRITQDLSEAANLLPNTSSISTRPNKASAYAMLARTYLSMEDYPRALINADAALKINNQLLDYNGLSQTSTTPFNALKFANKEILFYSVRASQPLLNPGSATGNVAKIDSSLVKSYALNDLRRFIFLKANSGSHLGTFRFTGNYEPVTSSNLFNGLATDEMYLVRAECYARAGQAPEAVKDLNDLLRTRWKTNTYVDISTSLTADQALAKVLEERRKELLMRGLRWTDLRRLNRDPRFKKDLSRKVDKLPEVYSLPANDLRYVLLIPREVINNTGMVQNAR